MKLIFGTPAVSLAIEEPSPTDDPFRIIFEQAKVSAQSLYGDDWPVGVRCRCQAIETSSSLAAASGSMR